ncbi:OsmC family protein [Aquincola sp. MAHUQ-54]|uniref:OsmC family protein n=1 Tax=Aquincola agrisoli TaxID=3119538 RepID=A0AAW9Q3I4_9BURK
MSIQATWEPKDAAAEGASATACEILLPGGALIADVDPRPGEAALRPSPHDLLDAALAACTTLTLELYSQRKGYALRQIRVQVKHAQSEGVYRMTRTIQVFGALTDEQRASLLRVAEACPVHKTLVGDIHIETHLDADVL